MIATASQILACGDRMVSVEFAPVIAPEINEAVHSLAAAVENARIPGIVECIPSYRALGVHYDPLQIRYSEIVRQLNDLLSSRQISAKRIPRRLEVPVVYGDDFGPDLNSLATIHGLSGEATVTRHLKAVYRVCLIGFTPGFPYLSGLPEELATPRLPTPRQAVPAGSVAIGGRQCGIYPVSSPGGWRIIGRTPLRLFNIQRSEPCLLAPGDEVVFRRICGSEFAEIASKADSL